VTDADPPEIDDIRARLDEIREELAASRPPLVSLQCPWRWRLRMV
jgi:hypothetical protein